jgi:hypothetical protein
MFQAESEDQERAGMVRILVVAALLCTVIPQAALAQREAPAPAKLVLALMGGLSAASGQAADNWKASYSVGAEADYTLVPQWVLTGTVAYNESTPKYSTSTDKAKVGELGVNIKYVITPSPSAQPYVRFGGGAYYRDVGSSSNETNVGLNGGAGVDFALPKSPIGFSLVARFHKIFITSTSVQTGDWEYFNFWGGVRLKVL